MSEMVIAALTGHGMAPPVLAFLLLGAIVFLLAARLSRHADAIADATGLGRVWVGTVLLAAATSLPELTTDVTAASLGAIDIGVGDLFGSTLANMAILALLDLYYARRRILAGVAIDHVLSATLAALLTGIASVAISVGGLGRIGFVGVETLVILALYLFGMHAVYSEAQVKAPPPTEQLALGESSRTLLRRGVRGLVLGTAGLLLCAPLLVTTAEALAREAGVSDGFVGTALVGLTTSFPEIAASVMAVRMGAPDLAVGNIFGSNAFNMCVLFAMDVTYRQGPVLAAASAAHAITGQIAVLCLALGMMAILTRAQRRPALVRIESLLILAAVAVAVGLLLHR